MAKLTGAAPIARLDGAPTHDLNFDQLDSLLGYRLRRAQGSMHRDFIAVIGSLELTQKQTATLWLIGANAGVGQATLADVLGMDRATMMVVVDRLEKRGFVVRSRSTADRRRQDLYLTPAGQRMLRKARAAIAENERRFKALFGAPELAALYEALAKIAHEA